MGIKSSVTKQIQSCRELHGDGAAKLKCQEYINKYDYLDADFYYEYGLILSALEEYNEAEIQFDKTIKLHPNTPSNELIVFEQYIYCLYKNKKYIQAKSKCQLFIEKWRWRYTDTFHNKHGDILYALKEYNEAEIQYQEAMELNPNNLTYITKYIRSMRQNGKYSLSKLKCEQTIKQFDDLPILFYDEYCTILFRLNEHKTAEITFEEAIKLHSNNNIFFEHYIYALAESKQHQKIKFDPLNAYFYTKYGRILYKLKQYNEAKIQFDKAIELYPNWILKQSFVDKSRIMHHRKYIYCLHMNGKYIEAKSECELLIKTSNNNLKDIFYNRYGAILYELKEYDKAEIQWQEAMKLNPNNLTYITKYIRSMRRNGKYSLSKLKCEQTIKQFDNLPASFYNEYVIILLKLNEYEAADITFEKAIKLHSNNSVYFVNYIYALYDSEQYEKARLQCQQAVNKFNSLSAYFYGYYGLILRNLKEYNEAKIQFNKAIELYPNWIKQSKPKYNSIKHANYLSCLERNHKYNEALKIAEEALNKYPEIGYIHHQCGHIYSGLYLYEKAGIQFKKAIEIKPNSIEHSHKRCYANYLCKIKQYEKAKNIIKSLLNAYETSNSTEINIKLYCAYAKALKGNGEYKECEQYLQKCIELDTEQKSCYVYVGYGHLCYLMFRYNEAIKYFDKSLAIREQNDSLHYYYALTLSKLNKFEQSEKHFVRTLEINPYFAECWCDYGVFLIEKLNKKIKGIEYIKKSIDLYPKNERVYYSNFNLILATSNDKRLNKVFK